MSGFSIIVSAHPLVTGIGSEDYKNSTVAIFRNVADYVTSSAENGFRFGPEGLRSSEHGPRKRAQT